MAKKKVNKNLKLLFVIVPFIVFSYFITRGIDLPYVGYNAWNFNTYSLIAKNYNSFGYVETKFAPIVSVAKSIPSKPKYYLHHPPLLPIIESFLFRIFGMNFWVGRLTVILFSFGSLFFMYLISKELRGEKYAILSLFIAVLIPASSVFGRMIDMEPLVLFFVLVLVYYLLQYLKSNKKRYLLLIILSVILGTLSDWPMTYFTVVLSPFLMYKKKLRLALLIIATSALAEIAFLSYVYILMNGFGDLVSAILTRSTGELLTLQYWPIIWMLTILLRFILYFNPLFVLFSFLYLLTMLEGFRKRKITEENLILLSLFLLGFFYVFFFPEGSFGHAYWIYYFMPFIAFSSASFLFKLALSKRYILLFLLFCFSFYFLWKINNWKVKEVEANVFRYTLAKKVDAYLYPYEVILVNSNGVVDPDLFFYAFSHEVKSIDARNRLRYSEQYNSFIYSCIYTCDTSDSTMKAMILQYKHTVVEITEAQAYIFRLKEKSEHIDLVDNKNDNISAQSTQDARRESFLRVLYRTLKDLLHAPQI